MSRHHNGPTGQRLMRLWQLLQQRDTPVVLIVEVASSCGIDPRQLLAERFCAGVQHG